MIAALSNPLRHRTHNTFITKRFFRQAYNTQDTLDSFNRILHDQVDIGQIQGALIQTVTKSLHPESVSLWLVRDD